MKKPLTGVSLKFKEAIYLSELFLILDDLKYVNFTGKIFIEKFKSSDETIKDYPYDDNSLLIRSMWNAMLIAYARCFATGIRYGLSPKIFDFHEKALELKKSHKYFIDMRSKNIAHSINSKETGETVALLSDVNDKEKKIEAIGYYGIKYIGGINEIEVLCNLTNIAGFYVQNEIEKHKEIVLNKAKEIPIEKLYDSTSPKYIVSGTEDAGNPRQK